MDKWTFDLSVLTAADVSDLLAADKGNVEATQRILEKVVKPSLDALPLTEWNAARKEVVTTAVKQMFQVDDAG